MIRWITVFIAISFAAAAQPLPERYMVSGVAADDVLNIRKDPTAASEKIGALNPDTLSVEVLRTQDGWGFIGTGERSGWVSMQLLATNPLPANNVPRPLVCSGTEPFWTYAMFQGGTVYSDLASVEDPRSQTITAERAASNGFLIQS